MKLRKFECLIQEKALDDLGFSGKTFEVISLEKEKIYTQADQRFYDEAGRNSKPFIVDDNGCSRDIEEMIKRGLIIEIL